MATLPGNKDLANFTYYVAVGAAPGPTFCYQASLNVSPRPPAALAGDAQCTEDPMPEDDTVSQCNQASAELADPPDIRCLGTS